MLRDLGDLGTPSAPPIIDIPSYERSTEAEDQQPGDSRILTENDQSNNVGCPPSEPDCFEMGIKGLPNQTSGFMERQELGKRYSKRICKFF